jgi:hypothetical protein
MFRRILVLMACGGAIALAACSDDEGDRYPDTDSFCTARAEEECKGVYALCATSVESCTAKRKPACLSEAATATSQGRSYRAGSAEACISKTHDLYDAKTIDPKTQTEQIDVCQRVFTGTKTKTQSCDVAYQCEGTLVCDKAYCADKVEKNADEGCNDPGAVCKDGYFCAGDATSLKFCKPKAAKGEACSETTPCTDGLRCDGTCQDKVGPGQACKSSEDCAAAAPYCDVGGTGKCQLQFQAGTQACKDFGG